MKKYKIIFWVATIVIFLFEGVMPVLTFQTELAKEGIRHLGYPEYFGTMFMVFKALGAIALIIPKLSPRIKEWAYAGFGIDFICAFISILVVDGFTSLVLLPLITFILLIASYISYHKIHSTFGL